MDLEKEATVSRIIPRLPLLSAIILILFVTLAFWYYTNRNYLPTDNHQISVSPRVQQTVSDSGISPTKTCIHSPSLQLNAEGAEIVLINSQGKKTGYDTDSKQYIQEIANSNYTTSEIVPPGAQPDNKVDRQIYISQDAEEQYDLMLFGLSLNNGEIPGPTFNLRFSGTDKCLKSATNTLSGSIKSGEILKYTVIFDPKLGIKIMKADVDLPLNKWNMVTNHTFKYSFSYPPDYVIPALTLYPNANVTESNRVMIVKNFGKSSSPSDQLTITYM